MGAPTHPGVAAAALGVAALWGVSPVCQKELLKDLPFELVFALSSLVYALATLAFVAVRRHAIFPHLRDVTGKHVALLLLSALLATFLANLVFLRLVRDHSTFLVTALAFTSPVFTLALAWLLLREEVRPAQVIGVLLVVAGVVALSITERDIK